jgi:hypothetical protein
MAEKSAKELCVDLYKQARVVRFETPADELASALVDLADRMKILLDHPQGKDTMLDFQRRSGHNLADASTKKITFFMPRFRNAVFETLDPPALKTDGAMAQALHEMTEMITSARSANQAEANRVPQPHIPIIVGDGTRHYGPSSGHNGRLGAYGEKDFFLPPEERQPAPTGAGGTQSATPVAQEIVVDGRQV